MQFNNLYEKLFTGMNLSFIEQHGGDSTHLIWIKYFTIPCKIQKNTGITQSSFDHFLESFLYNPANSRTIKKHIEKVHDANHIETILAEDFLFHNITPINVIHFSQLVIEQTNSICKSPNYHLTSQFIMRGFISLSYSIQSIIQSYLSNSPMENFQPELFKYIHYPLLYLFQDRNELFNDTIIIIDKYFNAFSCIDNFFKLQPDDPLRQSFLSLLGIVLNVFDFELPLKSFKCLDFLFCCFMSRSKKITTKEESGDLIRNVTILFKKLIDSSVYLDPIRCESLLALFNTIFMKINSVYTEPNQTVKSFINSGLTFISKIVNHLTETNSKELAINIYNFFKWTIESFSFEQIYDISNECESNDSFSLSDWPTYFLSKSTETFFNHKIKDEQLNKIVTAFHSILSQSSTSIHVFLETFQSCICSNEDNKLKTEISILFITCFYNCNINLNNFSQSFFLDLIDLSNCTQLSVSNEYHELYLQFLLELSCQSSEKLTFVLNIIRLFIRKGQMTNIKYFFGLFRSLLQVDSNINFVHYFLQSRLIETIHQRINHLNNDDGVIEPISAFLQSIAIARPIEVFNAPNYLQLVHSLLLIDNQEITDMLAPTFKIGLSLSHSLLLDQGKLAVRSTLEQIEIILKQVNENSEKRLNNLSILMVTYLTESIASFDTSIIKYLIKIGFFTHIAKLPSFIKSDTSFLSIIKLFCKIGFVFSNFYTSMLNNTELLILIKEIETSSRSIKLNDEIINHLIGFLFNQLQYSPKGKMIIQNSFAIPLILNLIEDTEYEEKIMKSFLDLCHQSIENAYLCFMQDIIGYTLDQITKDKFIHLNLDLFKCISSNFFSKFSLNQFFKAMRLAPDNKRHHYHQFLMNVFLDLLIYDTSIPVSSYFHFSNKDEGLELSNINSNYFSFPFSFVTTFKVDESKAELGKRSNSFDSNSFFPIVSIEQGNLVYFSAAIHNSSFVVVHLDRIVTNISLPIQCNEWYQLIVIFHQTNIEVSLNGKLFEPFTNQKTDFHDKFRIFFGRSSLNLINLFVNNSYHDLNRSNIELRRSNIPLHLSSSILVIPPSNDDLIPDLISIFRGFLGPAFFLKCNSVDDARHDYETIKTSRHHLKSSFITIVPWLVQKGTISGVLKKDDSYSYYLFKGFAVPSCSSLSSIVQNDGIFQCFLPLFILASHPCDNETEIVNDDSFFYLVLLAFHKILDLSNTVQDLFEKIGGFQLLAGFFVQIRTTLFTKMVLTTLELIYRSLTKNSLKFQMIINIWFNFDLWSKMSSEFQDNLYNDFLPQIITDDDLLGIKSFDFILYLIQMPFNIRTQPLLLFNNINEINKSCQLTLTEQNKIRKSQWKFFNRCLIIQPSATTMVNVSMIISFHFDLEIRLLAFKQMEKFLKSNQSYISAVMDMVNDYEYFLTLVFDPSPEIQFHAISCIFLLGKQELKGNYTNKNRNISIASMALTIHLVEPQTIADRLFDLSISYVYESQNEIMQMSSILPFVFWISLYVDPLKVSNFSLRLQKSFESSIENYQRYFEDASWPLWLIFFAFIQSQRKVDAFVSFLSSALYPLFLLEKVEDFHRFYFFFEIFADYFNCSFDNLLIKLTKSLYNKLNQNKIYSVDFFIQAFYLIFYKNTCSNSVDFTEIDLEKLGGFLDYFMKLNVNHFENRKISYIYRLSEAMDNDCIDLIFELLKSLKLLISNNPYIVFDVYNDFSITAFDIFCYFCDFLKTNGNYQIESKNLLRDVIKTMSLQAHSASFDNTTDFGKKFPFMELEKIVGPPDAIVEKFVAFYSSENKKVQKSFQQMLMTVSKKDRSKFNESFNEFIKIYSNTQLIASLHNIKLATSFFREVTSNSSPWSTGIEQDVKWKKITKIDHEGRNIFMKINRNFDDHKSASQLRNSLDNNSSNSNDGINRPQIRSKISNFQKFLNQRDASFIPAPIEHIKANAAFSATQITLKKRITGTLYISDTQFIFDGKEFVDMFGTKIANENQYKYIEIDFNSISFIFWRKILHLDIGIEIFTKSNNSFLFSLCSKEKRNEFLESAKKILDKAVSYSSEPFEIFRKACASCVQMIPSNELLQQSKITKLWQTREISNFTYLLYLNILSGRSFNDISQYPVFPWILKDYTSDTLNLDDETIYRDLSKSIGALNPKCIAKMKRKLAECPDPSQYCLFRSHFSTSAFVIGYLIRLEPFSTLHICLQGGSYDIGERLFYSIPKAWTSITNDQQNDFRELIPEFFFDETFLINSNGFDLGYLISGPNGERDKKINDVELPKWSKSPRDFINIHRKALESDYVSSHLHNWINLIFGVHQRSIDHDNLFHPYTYPDSINDNSFDLSVIQGYAANFGIYPTCLFTQSHPKREINRPIHVHFQLPVIDPNDSIIWCNNGTFLTRKPFIYRIKQNSILSPNFNLPDNIIGLNNRHLFGLTRGGTTVSCYSLKTGNEISTFSHSNSIINCLHCVGNKAIITGGSDCAICIWRSMNLQLIGSIPSYSLPIVSVFGSSKYDLIVAVDIQHNVFYHSLRNQHFIHSFKLHHCPNDANHIIRMTGDPLICILSTTPYNETKSLIELFDLIGNRVKVIETDGKVLSFDTISTKSGQNLFFYANSYKEIYIYETHHFTLIKKISENILPEFVTRISDNKSIIAIKKITSQQYSFVQYDF